MAFLKHRSEALRTQVVDFLRDLVRIPSTSGDEGPVAARIVEEMERLGFDEARIDDLGNVIGRVGRGPLRIVYDGHIDTVDVGNPESWTFDPFEGKVGDGYIYGRGASDNKAATAVQVYGAHLLRRLAKNLDEVSVYVLGSVQEEDCDGLGHRYAIEESIGEVDYVCLGESTDLDVYRGHRGRIEIEVTARGVSCHASAPERGNNAIYEMMPLVADIEQLHERLATDPFLGKGSCAVTHMSCETPSLCAVPDGCRIHIDRRLTHGEDKEIAVRQLRELPHFDPASMAIEVLRYARPSYTGKVIEVEKYFPTWVIPEDHELVRAGVDAATRVRGSAPAVSRWVFSTNGVFTMGLSGKPPTIGFGPAREEDAHSADDKVRIDDLITSIAFYASLPASLLAARAKMNMLREARGGKLASETP